MILFYAQHGIDNITSFVYSKYSNFAYNHSIIVVGILPWIYNHGC
jgi:hypothetical protein